MLPCGIKQLTGFDCPGCGFQRSLLSLLKGDFTQSFEYYPPLTLIIALMFVLILHLFLDLKYGATILKWLFITTNVAVLINYIVKMLSFTS